MIFWFALGLAIGDNKGPTIFDTIGLIIFIIFIISAFSMIFFGKEFANIMLFLSEKFEDKER